MINFICCYFNFANCNTIKNNYIKFRKYFPYPITTVELALETQDFFIQDSIKIRACANNILWQKERCLNIAIDTLPDSAKYIAWVDTDIIFHNPQFLKDTLSALEQFPVVQMFEKCTETPTVNPVHNNISIGKKIVQNIDIKYPAIGFCWAFHKDILIDNKLYDWDPVGNSDVLQLLVWLGLWNHRSIIDLNYPYRKEFLLWAWNSYANVQGNIGYVPGIIEHLYHGHINNRKYLSRNRLLIQNNFIPSKDLKIDQNLLYMTDNLSLRDDIFQYFIDRTTATTNLV